MNTPDQNDVSTAPGSLRDAVTEKKEELDFIINYDIKYRMGLSGGSAGEEAGDA